MSKSRSFKRIRQIPGPSTLLVRQVLADISSKEKQASCEQFKSGMELNKSFKALKKQHNAGVEPKRRLLAQKSNVIGFRRYPKLSKIASFIHKKDAIIGVQFVIKYEFKNPDLLWEALHKYYLFHVRGHEKADNRPLAVLGDAILSFVVIESNFQPGETAGAYAQERRFAKLNPKLKTRLGTMDAVREKLLCNKNLCAVFMRRGLNSWTFECRPIDHIRPAATALEALVGAVYRDGGLAAAKHVIHTLSIGPEAEPGL